MSQKFTADAVTALLALVGTNIEPARAANVAEALATQVSAANAVYASLPFEAEPAGYLHACAEAAP
ncbi:MAG: hypothetical protein WC830_16420 [Burkholderiales bacterium]|jgi:hypothetical protein